MYHHVYLLYMGYIGHVGEDLGNTLRPGTLPRVPTISPLNQPFLREVNLSAEDHPDTTEERGLGGITFPLKHDC